MHSKKDNHLKNLVSFFFVTGVFTGFSGTFIPAGGIQHLAWALGAFFLIIGSSLLASKLSRQEHDIPAAGFSVFAVGQALAYGFLATNDAGSEQFGAVIAIYVPGLVLISFYDLTPWYFRLCGFFAAASFMTLAVLIFCHLQSEMLSSILNNSAYMAMNIMILGWAWLVFKRKI